MLPDRRRFSQLRGGEADPRAGHEQGSEVRAAKHAARRARNGHCDHAVDAALRVVSRHAPSVPVRAPDESFRIDGHSVGRAGALRHFRKDTLVLDAAAIGVEVVDVDVPPPAIGEVEMLVVRAPAKAVGDVDAGFHHGHPAVRIEPVQRAGGGRRVERQGPGPEATAAVAFAVIEAVAGPVGLRRGDQRNLARRKVDALEAALHGGDKAAPAPWNDRADQLRHAHGLGRPRGGVADMNGGRENIDPVELLFAGRPCRPLAQECGERHRGPHIGADLAQRLGSDGDRHQRLPRIA